MPLTEGETMETTICSQCHSDTQEYGRTRTGAVVCDACCADLDRAQMHETGHIMLYLVQRSERWVVTNGPGTLEYRVRERRQGRHNIAGRRMDVWFTDDMGQPWHGTQYGDWTDICHCRRMKRER